MHTSASPCLSLYICISPKFSSTFRGLCAVLILELYCGEHETIVLVILKALAVWKEAGTPF